MLGFGKVQRMVERIDDENAREQEIRGLLAVRCGRDERIGPANDPLTLFCLFFLVIRVLNGKCRQRQERHAAETTALEVCDGRLGRLRILCDDVLLIAAQGNLDGRHIVLRDGEKLGHRTGHPLVPRLFAALQDGPRRFAKALVFLLHVHENIEFFLRARSLLAQVFLRFTQGRQFLLHGLLCMARLLLRLYRLLQFLFFLHQRGLHGCAVFLQLPCLLLCRGNGCLLLLLAFAAVLDIAVEHSKFLACGGKGSLRLFLLLRGLLRLLFLFCQGLLHMLGTLLQGGKPLTGLGQLRFFLRGFARQTADFADRTDEPLLEFLTLRFKALLCLGALPLTFLQCCHLAVGRFEALAQFFVGLGAAAHRLLEVENVLLDCLARRAILLDRRIEGHGFIARSAELFLIGRLAASLVFRAARELGQLAAPVFLIELVVLARLFRMAREGLELRLNLVHDVLHAQQIGLGIREFPHSLTLAAAVFRDARRLLEKGTAVLRPAVQDIFHAVLANDAHAVMTDARVGKEIVDILETAARTVDEVLALAAAVEPALSKISETSAILSGRRVAEPEKIMSSERVPRRFRIFCSPSTQRTASVMLLLPLPFGPTIAVMPWSNSIVSLSAKDLKP